MKHTKRILAMLLTVLMLVSVVPLGAIAAETVEAENKCTIGTSLYSFLFDGNGGSGSMNKMTVSKNQEFTLPANKFTKKGSIFQGWNVKRNSDGKFFVSVKGWLSPSEISAQKVSKKLYANKGKYTFSASWQNGTERFDSFTFYAVWKTCSAHKWDGGKVTKAATASATGTKTYTCNLCGKTKTEKIPKITGYTFSFNGNSGSGSMSKITVVKNQDFTLPANKFTKKGSIFQGWNVKRNSDGKFFVSEKGWLSTSEISAQKVSKKLYANQGKYNFSASWQYGSKENDSFTFYAVWKACSAHKWDGGKVTKAATASATGTKTYTCTLCGQTKTETIPKTAATNPTVSLRATTDITTSSATVHLTAKNPGKLLVTARGVQVKKKGASSWAKTYSEDLSQKTYNKDTEITGYFDIGSGKEVNYALSAGTTYEYRCFVTSGGTNYYSSVSTFTTLPAPTSNADPYFEKVWASGISDTNATINAEFSSLTSVKSTGFYFGTDASSLKKITKNLDGKADGAGKVKKIYFGLNGWYGKLTPGTTYYYKIFYTNSSGKECASNVYSFITTGTTTYNFTVKYDANGGKGTMAQQSVKGGQVLVLTKNTFTKQGYTFSGWNVKRGSDSKWYVAGQGWKTQSDITKNKWEKKPYDDGGSYTFDSSWSNGAKTDDTFTFVAVWKACAHTWDGGVVTKEPTTSATGVMTYTCEICGKTKTEKIPVLSIYQIKFNANGGKGAMAAMRVDVDKDFILPENQFTKAGYTFAGWTVKRSSDNKWYVPNEGWKTTKEIKDNGWSKKVYESGEEYRFNAGWINGSKTSDTYTFYAVWKTCEHEWDEGVVTKEPTTSATGVMTYTCEICGKTKTAKIPKISTYQIKFNANGGKGSIAGMKVEKEESFTLPENSFTKAGYTFVGWGVKRSSDSKWLVEEDGWQTNNEIKANGYEKLLFDEDVDLALDDEWINSSKVTDTYTFYAMWEKDV